jgi:hypothetical protein
MPQPISKEMRRKMEYENAVEVWELHDSVLISEYVDTNPKYQGVGFYNSYAAMGQAAEIPFFTIRNSSIVDPAYCNFDSKDKMNFAFHCFSIGVDFIPPIMNGVENENAVARGAVFSAELPKHASFVLTLNQDEKVVATVPLLPSGQGTVGDMVPAHASPNTGPADMAANYANGQATIKNRWEFKSPGPLRIPRNVTIKGALRFSTIGRAILAGMENPGTAQVTNDPTPGQGTGEVELAALIRVSLFGVREVQLRNLQHF